MKEKWKTDVSEIYNKNTLFHLKQANQSISEIKEDILKYSVYYGGSCHLLLSRIHSLISDLEKIKEHLYKNAHIWID